MLTSLVDDLSSFALLLSDGQKELFASPLHWTILSNGDADFHDNVIFFGFDSNQEEPVLVAKVPRLVENGWMLKVEYERLVELWNTIGVSAASYIPRPYALTLLQDRAVLLISYAPGESLTRLPARSFWRNTRKVLGLGRDAAHSLRNLNRLTERPREENEAQNARWLEKVEKFKDLFQLTPEEEQTLEQLINEKIKDGSEDNSAE